MFLGALPHKAGGSSALGKADHGEHPHGAGIGVSRHPREAGIRARRASAPGGHPHVAGIRVRRVTWAKAALLPGRTAHAPLLLLLLALA